VPEEEILPLVSRSQLGVGVSSNVKRIRMPTRSRGRGTQSRALRVRFCVESPDRIEEGMRRLAAAVRAVLQRIFDRSRALPALIEAGFDSPLCKQSPEVDGVKLQEGQKQEAARSRAASLSCRWSNPPMVKFVVQTAIFRRRFAPIAKPIPPRPIKAKEQGSGVGAA